jgi:sulfate adenylyltransferase subunit 1
MDILKFLTCGSVDDGKSTLIGRLLYDSKAVSPDVLEAIARQSRNLPEGQIDLSLLTDGLRSEREQGITIDVAYKYFSTPRRKFIIADAPGHIQYTRNMVTGASTAQVALILIDARQGVIEQTRRHAAIAALLGIPHVAVCINKMDLIHYDESTYTRIAQQFGALAQQLSLQSVNFIPVSALAGDNVVNRSTHTHWYTGQTLLEYLETVPVADTVNLSSSRFQVQYVIRPKSDDLHDYRGYAGHIQSGVYRKGDRVTVFPSGLQSSISAIEVNQQEVNEAQAGQPAVIHLKDDIDVSRGMTIVRHDQLPLVSQDVEAVLCVTDTAPLFAGSKLLLQHHSHTVKAIVKEIYYKIDIETYERLPQPPGLQVNDLAYVRLRTAEPLAFDPYLKNRTTGAFILINENTCQTVAAGMIQPIESDFVI